MFTIVTNTQVVSAILIGFLIPFLIALVTKRVSSATLKATLLLVLTILSGGVNEWIASSNAGTDFMWQAWAVTAIVAFFTGVGPILGLNPLVGQNGAIQNAVPGGLGKAVQVIAPAGAEQVVAEAVTNQVQPPPAD